MAGYGGNSDHKCPNLRGTTLSTFTIARASNVTQLHLFEVEVHEVNLFGEIFELVVSYYPSFVSIEKTL